MFRNFGIAALLTIAVALPVHEAAAQGGAFGGALFGGAAGAAIGGAVGGGRGAATGAIVGATTGAIIGAQAEQRQGGYYYWHQGCYIQRPDGVWVRVSRRYCQ